MRKIFQKFGKVSNFNKPPVKVVVTGATGRVGYSVPFSIGAGNMLGMDQPVILSLYDLPSA